MSRLEALEDLAIYVKCLLDTVRLENDLFGEDGHIKNKYFGIVIGSGIVERNGKPVSRGSLRAYLAAVPWWAWVMVGFLLAAVPMLLFIIVGNVMGPNLANLNNGMPPR